MSRVLTNMHPTSASGLCREGPDFKRENWGRSFKLAAAPELLPLNSRVSASIIQNGDFTMWKSNSIIGYLTSHDASPAPCPSIRTYVQS